MLATCKDKSDVLNSRFFNFFYVVKRKILNDVNVFPIERVESGAA